MKEIFEEITRLLTQGESFVLATIFSSSGSAPRTAGARMIIRQDGSISGTIGGGILEARIQEAAPTLFEKKNALVKDFKLTGKDASVLEMICGGEVEVLAEYIDAQNSSYLAIYQELLAAIQAHRSAWQIITLPETEGEFSGSQRCLVRSQDPTIKGWGVVATGGSLGCDQIPEAILREVMQQPEIATTQYPLVVKLSNRRLLIEPVTYFGTVYLMGGGHISQKLAPLARMAGFETIVIDDRPEFVSAERFPNADRRVLVKSFDEALQEFTIDANSYIVIVTRGHLHDKTVLAQVLKSQPGYIGMIGSLRKRDLIYKELEQAGFQRSEFQRVHSPIGLPIGAESPEEIAISIAAELISMRAKKS